MISFLVQYPGTSLAASAAGLLGLFVAASPAHQRRQTLALIALVPVSPLLAVSLCAYLATEFCNWALNSCGPFTRLWRWAAQQLASGGRHES